MFETAEFQRYLHLRYPAMIDWFEQELSVVRSVIDIGAAGREK